MRIKIKRGTVVCGGSVAADYYRKALKKLEGRWVQVETDIIFQDQYNTADLRIFDRDVEKIDYEKDGVLEAAHVAMRTGKVRCHSYCHKTGVFIDLHSPLPSEVGLKILHEAAKRLAS